MSTSISAIVPFYNERGRVERILQGLLDTKEIDVVIAVNDASTDGGIAPDEFVGLHYLAHAKNRGKAAAIATALDHVKTEYVLLFDADLRDFDTTEIVTGCQELLVHEWDMLIFRRVKTIMTVRMIKADLLLTGERFVRTSDLRKVFELHNPEGYRIELMLNKYMLDHHKRVSWVPISVNNTYKLTKRGAWQGALDFVEMNREVMRDGGLREYVRQARNIR